MKKADQQSDVNGDDSREGAHGRFVPEVVATAGLGGLLGALTIGGVSAILGRGHQRRQHRQAAIVVGGIFGLISGLLAGQQKMYAWSTRRGRKAFIADHTWALVTTGLGVTTAGMNFVLGAKVEELLSRRQNRLVFDGGFVLRPGFAVSVGYVVSGAADRNGVITERRRKLVTVHEDVHIWQARRWGPFYPVLYGLWFVGGAFIGLQRWWAEGSNGRSIMTHIDAAAYYSNPFEWRAYTEDDNWPPATADSRLVWSERFRGSLFKG